MAKVSATTQSSTNPYSTFFGNGMANDFFGSQAFGNCFGGSSIYSAPQQTQQVQQPQILNENPTNIASALLGQHYLLTQQAVAQQQAQAGVQTGVQPQVTAQTQSVLNNPTMQDYYVGTQIASLFSNANTALISPYDSYFQRDFFGQQMIANSNQNRVSYSA